MPPCVDAHLQLAPAAVGSLLQLPDGWRACGLRVVAGVLEVDVVFADGPSEHAPIRLVPHYKRVYTDDGVALRLDRLDVDSQLADRPAKQRRPRWMMDRP